MIRRCIDILVSTAVLLLLSPVFLVIMIAIPLDSPGKAIYRARRVGRNGCLFEMLKFRTMVDNADQLGPAVTSSNDRRVTRVGSFLRATKLDEFPQFWNVLRGDMTLIGPRPEAIEFVRHYSPDQMQILSLKPGLTGPSQISCTVDESMTVASDESAEAYYVNNVLGRRLAIDAEYLRNRNLANDVALIFKTISVIFGGLRRGTWNRVGIPRNRGCATLRMPNDP
jgi:lipopolysaccharide/colanic/teichoic acid biosynthesis glycosyltransferase